MFSRFTFDVILIRPLLDWLRYFACLWKPNETCELLINILCFLDFEKESYNYKKFAQIDSYLEKSRYPYGPCVIKTNKYCLKRGKKDQSANLASLSCPSK